MFGQYDRVYMSKVFTFTPDYPYGFPCEVIKGGTGYRDYATVLPPEVEHTCPDYGLYNLSCGNRFSDPRMRESLPVVRGSPKRGRIAGKR